jgi:hypothetical protein
MAFTRSQIRDSIERAGDEHWQALIRHHEDAYPESRPTPGDVARAEAERLNELGLGDNPDLELVESRVEAVILTGYERDATLYDLLRRYEIPFVISWSTSPDPDVPSISFDNYAASRDVVERLLGLGHRRIALMCGVTAVNDRAAQRLAGEVRQAPAQSFRRGQPGEPQQRREQGILQQALQMVGAATAALGERQPQQAEHQRG